MKTELIIGNKRSGKMWEVSNSTTTVSYTTERTGSPGKLTFTVIKSGDLDFVERATHFLRLGVHQEQRPLGRHRRDLL